MKKYRIIVTAILVVLLNAILLTACNNSASSNQEEKIINDSIKSSTDTLPEIIKEDTLTEEYKVVVVATYEDGSPRKVHFCNPDNPNEALYEKQYHDTGELYIEGALENDRRDGKWLAYYKSGVLWSVGYYKNGLKHGESNVYYENGQTRYNKIYEEDVAVGLWKFYDPEGNLLGEVMYENGKVLWQEGVPEE
jgi:antitoxin component YwqK of YwqJK toxin-antitoxin module